MTPGEAAELWAKAIGLDLEFLYGILSGDERGEIHVASIHRSAVDKGGALVGLSASDLKVAPSKWVGAGGGAAGLPTGYHAGHQGDESEHVTPIERHFEHLARLNDVSEGRVFGFQERSLRGDFKRLRNVANLHRHVDADHTLHFDGDVGPYEAAETSFFYFHPILPGR